MIDVATLSDGDDRTWDWAIQSAAKLLVVGLRLGSTGIPRDYANEVRSLVLTALALTSREIDVEGFEDRFEKDAFFTAKDTPLGITVELCVLLTWWMHVDVKAEDRPRSAVTAEPAITRALQNQLADRTATGRIPRAIMACYLRLLHYADEGWLKSQMAALFPKDDDLLRDAAWRSHMMNDQGPVRELMSDLEACYFEEIDRLSNPETSPGYDDRNIRKRRFASYVMVLVLEDAATEGMIQRFVERAPASIRRGAMWFVGGEISKPLSAYPKMPAVAVLTIGNSV